jgi:hypothetical protein
VVFCDLRGSIRQGPKHLSLNRTPHASGTGPFSGAIDIVCTENGGQRYWVIQKAAQAVYDRKAEAAIAVLISRGKLVELTENIALLIFGNADPAVPDFDLQASAVIDGVQKTEDLMLCVAWQRNALAGLTSQTS